MEKKRIQQDFLLRLKYLTDNMVSSTVGDKVTDRNVIELCIICIVSDRISNVFELSSEDDVSVEILIPWLTVQTYKELLKLYEDNIRLRDDLYLDLLEKTSNKIFMNLFASH